MEDILASIKRIIADDKQMPLDRPTPPSLAAAPPSLRPPAWPDRPAASLDRPSPWPVRSEPPQPPESILELTDRLPAEMPPLVAPAPPPPPIAMPRAVERPRAADMSWTVPEEPEPAPIAAPPPPRRPVAPDIGSMIVNRAAGGDNTIEGLVREMLRPMIRDWVDANLPAMVERLVQQEIKALMEREGETE